MPDRKGLPDPRATREIKDLPDRLVRRETGATLDRKGRQGRRAKPVHQGLPDPRVTRESKDLPDRLVRKESGATLGRKEIPDPRATQVRKVIRDLPA